MATYFVSSSGSNTTPYDTWNTAATSISTALTAASTDGDIVVVQYNGVPSGDAEVSTATTYTIGNSIKLIAASNNGGSSYTPTAMGSSYWLGNSTASRALTLTVNGASVVVWGITFRTAGTSASNIIIGSGTDHQITLDNCYIWQGNTTPSAATRFGPATNSANSYIKIRNTTLRLSNSGQNLRAAAEIEMENCTYTGSLIGDLWQGSESTDPGGGTCVCVGCDFSATANTCNLVGDSIRPVLYYKFIQCKLSSSYVPLGPQTVPNKSSARVWLYDCSAGDTHGILEYADALGRVSINNSIYYTATPSLCSWKIETNSNCRDTAPFETPWIDFYNTSYSTITPRIEILREGSFTPYTNAEVWGEFFVKNTSGTSMSNFFTDKVAFMGAPANQATGASAEAWTGESTAWFGKVDTGTTVTPAEAGMIRGRVCVGIPSATLYVEPYIRT